MWVSVLGTLVVMVLVLSFLSGFYRKYFRTTTDKDQREIKYSLIDFRALSDYTLYMLKIITYKGKTELQIFKCNIALHFLLTCIN